MRVSGTAVKPVILAVLLVAAFVLAIRALRTYERVAEAERLFVKADQQMERKRWQEALATLEQVVELDPVFFPAYEARSDIYWQVLKDKTRALAALQAALPYCRDDPRLYRALGYLHLAVTRDYCSAQAALQTACRLDPTDHTARGLLRQADAEMVRRP